MAGKKGIKSSEATTSNHCSVIHFPAVHILALNNACLEHNEHLDGSCLLHNLLINSKIYNKMSGFYVKFLARYQSISGIIYSIMTWLHYTNAVLCLQDEVSV